MSSQEQSVNPGSDAAENNLAGTRDEFNAEVTTRLVEEAASGKHTTEERADQPALEVDEDSPVSPASS